MFVDKASVKIKAGDGGNGAISFRHEKYIDKGGPDGGDGGKGGDIIFVASNNQNTLATFRYQKLLKADSGHPGTKRKKHGKNGNDLKIYVPIGTILLTEVGETLFDLTENNQEIVIAKGGLGGYGNAHFVSSTRQAPKLAEKGESGEEMKILLELKMIADIGLIGLPNAGKSTLLSVVSNAKPEIADYPFTTLTPNLGVADISKSDSLLLADIPGLIEGASTGKGLGDEFLRHVERTPVLAHLIDSYSNDVVHDYETIIGELKSYKIDLSKKPQVVVMTKIDGLDRDIIDLQAKTLKKILPRGTKIFALSAQSKEGLKEFLYGASKLATAQKNKKTKSDEKDKKLPILTISSENKWNVKKTSKGFIVTGHRIEKFAGRTDFSNFHGTQRLRDIMKKMGILHELVRQGIKPGDKIYIAKHGNLEY